MKLTRDYCVAHDGTKHSRRGVYQRFLEIRLLGRFAEYQGVKAKSKARNYVYEVISEAKVLFYDKARNKVIVQRGLNTEHFFDNPRGVKFMLRWNTSPKRTISRETFDNLEKLAAAGKLPKNCYWMEIFN